MTDLALIRLSAISKQRRRVPVYDPQYPRTLKQPQAVWP